MMIIMMIMILLIKMPIMSLRTTKNHNSIDKYVVVQQAGHPPQHSWCHYWLESCVRSNGRTQHSPSSWQCDCVGPGSRSSALCVWLNLEVHLCSGKFAMNIIFYLNLFTSDNLELKRKPVGEQKIQE